MDFWIVGFLNFGFWQCRILEFADFEILGCYEFLIGDHS